MEAEITQTALVLFGGVAVSLIIEVLKKRWSLNATGNMVLIVALALIGAVGYEALTQLGYWDTFVRIVTTAGAFYAFIIRNLKS